MSSLNRINVLGSRLVKNSMRSMSQEVFPPSHEPEIPAYQERVGEPLDLKKARLLYQSRKRGMLENGLLLSTFAAKYLSSMNEDMIKQYDQLINVPSNDWDIYYWATGVRPVPLQFNNDIMKLLQDHTKNNDRQTRLRQPDLYETVV